MESLTLIFGVRSPFESLRTWWACVQCVVYEVERLVV
jgi:hypothetical protein